MLGVKICYGIAMQGNLASMYRLRSICLDGNGCLLLSYLGDTSLGFKPPSPSLHHDDISDLCMADRSHFLWRASRHVLSSHLFVTVRAPACH